MPKKKQVEEEEEEEEEDDFEDDSLEEEVITCRVCGKDFETGDGDDYILICDDCAEKYNMDKIWNDFDSGKIDEEELGTFDLTPYKLKK